MTHFGDILGLLPGINIVEDINLTLPGETIEVERSWKERLFTLPWRPFTKTKIKMLMLPSPELYLFREHNLIVGHPETIKKLYKELEKVNAETAFDPPI